MANEIFYPTENHHKYDYFESHHETQLKLSSHMQEIGSPLVYASLDTFRFGDYNSLKLK